MLAINGIAARGTETVESERENDLRPSPLDKRRLCEIAKRNRKQRGNAVAMKAEYRRDGARAERGERASEGAGNIKEEEARREERRGPPERVVQDWLGTGGARHTFGGSPLSCPLARDRPEPAGPVRGSFTSFLGVSIIVRRPRVLT